MHSFHQRHYIALLKLVQYVVSTADKELIIRNWEESIETSLHAYSDSDYAGCKVTRRSVTGGAILLGPNLIDWVSVRQSLVTDNVTEAEYVAAHYISKDLVLIYTNILSFFNVTLRAPCLYIDNEAAKIIADRPDDGHQALPLQRLKVPQAPRVGARIQAHC